MGKRPGGRPTKYKPEYCQQLINHMKMGRSYESFAAEVHVCDDTLREWESKHPAFSAAKREGRVKSLRFWEDLLIENARGLPSNATSIIFVLKCRFRQFGYRDKFEDDPAESIVINNPAPSINLDAKELAKQYLSLKKQK